MILIIMMIKLIVNLINAHAKKLKILIAHITPLMPQFKNKLNLKARPKRENIFIGVVSVKCFVDLRCSAQNHSSRLETRGPYVVGQGVYLNDRW